MSDSKERAYRYDLLIAPDWRERFDLLVSENVPAPTSGRVLDVNCGTGAYAIDLAGKSKEKLEVVGVDPDEERIAIARNKALVAKVGNVSFEQGLAADLPFLSDEFDFVVGDTSLGSPYLVEEVLEEMIRVAKPGALVVMKAATHGSFDEFFSIYWEALFDSGVAEQHWSGLEQLIHERMTLSDAENLLERAGLENIKSFHSKEEFVFETGTAFIEVPIVSDVFLDSWLDIIPEDLRESLKERIVATIDRERHDGAFDVSIKAAVISGTKPE